GASCDVEREQQVLGEIMSRLLGGHFEGRAIVGSAGGHHHMMDRARQILEERLDCGRIAGVEGGGTLCAELTCCLPDSLLFAPGEDNAGALRASAPGGFQPYAGAAADHDNSLAEQFRFTGGCSRGCGCHGSSDRWCN